MMAHFLVTLLVQVCRIFAVTGGTTSEIPPVFFHFFITQAKKNPNPFILLQNPKKVLNKLNMMLQKARVQTAALFYSLGMDWGGVVLVSVLNCTQLAFLILRCVKNS